MKIYYFKDIHDIYLKFWCGLTGQMPIDEKTEIAFSGFIPTWHILQRRSTNSDLSTWFLVPYVVT